MVKKIHAVLTLLLSFVLLVHLVVTGLLMSKLVSMHLWFLVLANFLLFLLIAHVVLTFVPLLLHPSGKRTKPYVKLNWRCYTQRISGIAILALIPPHLIVFMHTNIPWPEKMAKALANPLQTAIPPAPVVLPNLLHFAALVGIALFCCFHVSISIPKALVGLGLIIEEKTLARAEKICFVFVGAISVLAIWGSCTLGRFSGLFGGAI